MKFVRFGALKPVKQNVVKNWYLLDSSRDKIDADCIFSDGGTGDSSRWTLANEVGAGEILQVHEAWVYTTVKALERVLNIRKRARESPMTWIASEVFIEEDASAPARGEKPGTLLVRKGSGSKSIVR